MASLAPLGTERSKKGGFGFVWAGGEDVVVPKAATKKYWLRSGASYAVPQVMPLESSR